jgi:hypothetical protein
MRRLLGFAIVAAGLAACGPWVIEQPTAEPPSATQTADGDAARALIAERFGIRPAALIATEEGYAFVVRSGEELQLLLSRDSTGSTIDVLARVEAAPFDDDRGGLSSFAVVCPTGSASVRHYLFGQDVREVERHLVGLIASGGEVVDGLWLLAIGEEEIAPDVEWELVDAAGTTIESATGQRFAADGETIGLGDSVLCEVNEH